ncbi:MAG: hypothetical protein JWP87_5246, partial [Labilithrix sp.]|nr:hypothetical protein [Labilithrix sp.]
MAKAATSKLSTTPIQRTIADEHST